MILVSLATFGLCACESDPLSIEDREFSVNQEVIDKDIPENLLISQQTNKNCGLEGGADIYRMGPKDQLSITVFEEKELSGTRTINDTGTISLPLIGEILFSGCTVREAEKIIQTHYADGYLINPSVSVEISKFRPFYILGEVRVPGQYDFAIDLNILKASAIAGGFTYRANQKIVKVLRYDAYGQPYNIMQPPEAKVHPGDVIIIKERFF